MNATSNIVDESGSPSSTSLGEGTQEGRNVGGQADSPLDSGEHELQLGVDEEDREVLPETRSGQEGDGLESGGEGLSVEREDSVGALGRGVGEGVGSEVDESLGEQGEEVTLAPDVQALLDSIVPSEVRFASSGGKVNREKRMIEGVSLVTRGEARGHYMWVDSTMLACVAGVKGKVKSRFGHPSPFKDDRITIGYIDNLRMAGDQVLGDMNLLESASDAPGLGDVAGYLLELAEKCPEMVALSIAFTRDVEAERSVIMSNLVKGKDGYSTFKSPDPKNKRNLPHARLAELMASDVVDMGAANPGGLFAVPDSIGDVRDFVEGRVPDFGKLPPGMLADALVARSNYAQFSAHTESEQEATEVGVEPATEQLSEATETEVEVSNLETGDDVTDAVAEVTDSPQFDACADEAAAKIAAAFSVRKSLSQEDADALRTFLSGEYRRFDRRAPWDRSESNWNLFGAICTAAEARGAELTDDFLATALDVVGFGAEAEAIVDSLAAEEEAESAVEATNDSDEGFSIEGFDAETVRTVIANLLDQRLAQRQGRLT